MEKDDQVDAKKDEKQIDFREYLLFALFIIKFKQPSIQLLELAFKVCSGCHLSLFVADKSISSARNYSCTAAR